MANVTDTKITPDNLPDGSDKNPYLGSLTIINFAVFYLGFYNLFE